VNAWHGVHQSALKYRPITILPFNTESVRREGWDGGRNRTDPVGATRSQVEYPCASWTDRLGPSCCTHALGGCEEGGGGDDGPGPPGVPTGWPCQAPAAAFIVANALSITPRNMASGHVIVTWIAQSSTSCRTVFPKVEWGSCSPSFHRSHA
jgi:hypothetical protein